MGVFDVVIVIFLVGVLGLGVYVLYLNWPSDPVEYESFSANYQFNVSGNKQFYSNMRYKESRISYSIEPICNEKKREDVLSTLSILTSRTVLNFYESANNPEIRV